MKRRRKFTTTKNTHGGMKKEKVFNGSHMRKIEMEQMENSKGSKIGINFSVKVPNMNEPIVGAGVYHYEGFEKLHTHYLKSLRATKIENNVTDSDSECAGVLIYQFIERYCEKNNDGTGVEFSDKFTEELVEYCLSFSLVHDEVKEKIKDRYNKYLTLTMVYSEPKEGSLQSQNQWEVHPTFEDFSKRGEELIKSVNPDYEDVEILLPQQEEEDFDQIQIVDEPIDYTIDDIQIIDDAPIPMLGLDYEILSKLKHSMSILEIGQTIKLPKDDRLRSSVYLLNKQHFTQKRFSVYEINNNFIVFLNTKNRE